jgi:hypothetical protein
MKNPVSFGGCEEIVNKKDISALDAVEYLCHKAENSGLGSEFWDNATVKRCLTKLKKYLPFSDNQMTLFSVISAYTLGKGAVEPREVGCKLNVSPFVMFELQGELDELETKDYIRVDFEPFNGEVYKANMDVLKSLRDDKVPEKPQGLVFNSNLEMIRYIGTHIFCREMAGELDIVFKKLEILFSHNKSLDMVEKFDFYKLNGFECFLLLFAIDCLVVRNSDLSYEDLFRVIEQSGTSYILQTKAYLNNKHGNLFELHLLKIIPGEFMEDNVLHLTDKSLKAFFPKEKKSLKAKTKGSDTDTKVFTIIKPGDIKEKELVYDDKTSAQVKALKDILDARGLKTLQANLVSNGLRSGVNVLLYGYPGTGKTETVLQMCKQTHRTVFQINISEMKSYWFGQSEKIVNSMFEQYKKLAKTTRLTPILLFNEADGVLSRRRNLENAGNCGQTENAIQNILLQAFENNEGIIICTTNMIDNIDTAFARRFLYKVEFSKPDTKTRSALIKLKLGRYLTDSDCMQLASKYEMTGGTLDNVVTKIIAQQCLRSATPTVDEIETYIRQDDMGDKRPAVGFNRN